MTSNSTVIYLGQIPYDWDENVIKSVVCGSGKLVDVRLGFDYKGKNKGFCFVEYLNPREAQNALGLLTRIKFKSPSGGLSTKKLRIELSKEGLRAHGESLNKPVLDINRNYLPPYVIQPQEMIQNSPPLQASLMYQGSSTLSGTGGSTPNTNTPSLNTGNANGLPRVPPSLPQPPRMSQNISSSNSNININSSNPQSQLPPPPQQPQFGYNNSPTPPSNPATPVIPQQQMPVSLTQASQSLPQPNTLPFKTPDKINETLSKIPPAQLVELIANLKNILGSSQAARAGDVFQLSPDLASSAAQALLLMGFVDADVISEAMKVTPPPAPPQQQQQQHFAPQPQYQQNFQQQHQNFVPPPNHNNYNINNNNNNHNINNNNNHNNNSNNNNNNNHNNNHNTNTTINNNSNHNNNHMMNRMGAPLPAPIPTNSKWPHLPPHTVAKLTAMAPDQAELIAQVLSLPPNQISSLPPDQQTMITNIRSQYL